MNILVTLGCFFGIYFIVDLLLYTIHKIRVLDYYRQKHPNQFSLYSFFPLVNIPLAIYCWIKYGDPINVWKLDES